MDAWNQSYEFVGGSTKREDVCLSMFVDIFVLREEYHLQIISTSLLENGPKREIRNN